MAGTTGVRLTAFLLMCVILVRAPKNLISGICDGCGWVQNWIYVIALVGGTECVSSLLKHRRK